MDRLRRLLASDGGIAIVINDRDLIEWVREVELPYAEREGASEIAGSYAPLPAETVLLPSRHMLGEPEARYASRDGRTQIFVCGDCQEDGCWPLSVRIEVDEDTVRWRDFEQPHRRLPGPHTQEWTYEGIGPFTFDRRQYEAAIRRPSILKRR